MALDLFINGNGIMGRFLEVFIFNNFVQLSYCIVVMEQFYTLKRLEGQKNLSGTNQPNVFGLSVIPVIFKLSIFFNFSINVSFGFGVTVNFVFRGFHENSKH